MYQYKCKILKVIDGDTVDVATDLGFDIRLNMRVRLAGIDAPEMNTAEGKASRLWLIDAMPVESEWTLATIKDRREKYGRYLGEFRQAENPTINQMIVEAGHAIEKQW
jgi:micrococcal nuclease